MTDRNFRLKRIKAAGVLSLFVCILTNPLTAQNKNVESMTLQEVETEIEETLAWLESKKIYMVLASTKNDPNRWQSFHTDLLADDGIKIDADKRTEKISFTIEGIRKETDEKYLSDTEKQNYEFYQATRRPRGYNYREFHKIAHCNWHHIDTIKISNNEIRFYTNEAIKESKNLKYYFMKPILAQKEWSSSSYASGHTRELSDEENETSYYSIISVKVKDRDMEERFKKAFDHLVRCSKQKFALQRETNNEKF